MRRYVYMLVLVLAGEMIFSLPFHTGRFFRPTLLEAFGFSNTLLGDAFAVYGITAMLTYFPGGALADRFAPRKLMTLSLFATAAGGLYMATFPGALGMALLYGYWGVTTIFLFWASLIGATRQWGGERSQGRAFGVLEGGRGLAAAGFAVIAAAVLGLYLPSETEWVSNAERQEGFRTVILLYSAITAAIGCMTWFLLPARKTAPVQQDTAVRTMAQVFRRPIVWAQAGIIVCAYCGYKGLDNYALYAVQVLGMDEVEAARFTANVSWLRPVAAIAAGIAADRLSASRTIAISFLVLIASYGCLAAAVPSSPWLKLIHANILVSFFAVFALRGVYFALLEETRTPKNITGTTIGMISFVGYTPEVFFGPITGRILDNAPGLPGHQHYFMFLAGVATLGLFVVGLLLRRNRGQMRADEAASR